MAKKMTMADIANLSGVGKSTVSRYFNGGYVKDETRAKIQKVIEEYNYTPNAFARSLGLNSMHTVGILCSDSSDVYQAQAIYYLERELRKNSYASMLCCTGCQLQEKQSYLHLLLSRKRGCSASDRFSFYREFPGRKPLYSGCRLQNPCIHPKRRVKKEKISTPFSVMTIWH